MDLFPFVKKDDILLTEYRPNMYKGHLKHKVVDITNDLKLLVYVKQFHVEVFDTAPHPPQIGCTYQIKVKEIKYGIVRPFHGCISIFKNRVKAEDTSFSYAKLDMSNFWDYNEPTKYMISLGVSIDEPYDENFHSTVIVSY